jgi:RPA family protein
MAEFKKRETAYKLKIGDILKGTPIVEEMPSLAPDSPTDSFKNAPKERFRFLELEDKKIVRVNIVANVVDKYNSEGEKKFSTITIDDASGQIRLKVFGDDVQKYAEFVQGDTVTIIGVLRSYNQEVYISPEIIKKTDPRYLLVRKLELEKGTKPITAEKKPEQVLQLREQIVQLIKAGEPEGGASTSDIILKITSSDPDTINSEIIKLIEDGIVYEPRPGRVRYLG